MLSRHSKLTLITKKIFSYYYDNWWLPILFFVFSVGIAEATEKINNEILWYIIFPISMFGFWGLIISAIYQLVKKRWIQGILTGLIFIFYFIYCLLYTIAEFLS